MMLQQGGFRPAFAALLEQTARASATTLPPVAQWLTRSAATLAKPAASSAATVVVAGNISGTVFRDYNGNGVFDVPAPETDDFSRRTIDKGVGGIKVTAYNAAGNAVGTATSAANGTYSIATSDVGNGPYRVEFTELPAGFLSGPAGTGSGTSVQFVTRTPAENVNFGINEPNDYCQNNPQVVTPCYIAGNPLAGGTAAAGDVFVAFPYDAGTKEQGSGVEVPAGGNTPMPRKLAIGSQIGATWGVAYQRNSQTIFAAAVTRRHSGYGALGEGGIYIIRNVNAPMATVQNFVNVASIGINVGSLPNRNLPASATQPNADATAFDAVGKIGIGDLDISDDGKTLWLTNLNDRKLYSIFVNDPAVTPTAANVNSYTIPTDRCSGGDFRPWATKFYKGRVYVGGVCAAQASQVRNDVKAIVFELNPATGAFANRLEFPLTYTKGITWVWPGVAEDQVRRQWNPWTSDFNRLVATPAEPVQPPRNFLIYPQPIFSDIEFDNDGSLIMGFLDRTAMQSGYLQADLNGNSNPAYEGMSGGDILRAFNNAGSFVLENNGSAGTISTGGANNGQGPGGGEFYFQEQYTQLGNLIHQENILGGLAMVPGSAQVLSDVFDPFTIRAAGVFWLNNATGRTERRYEVFGQPANPNEPSGTFGKSAGLGDLEILCDAAPIELGNRIWVDADRDGIQDANEPGIQGVIVQLYKGGVLVGTTTTNATGNYYFNAGNVTGGVLINMAYEIRVDKTQASLANTLLTLTKADASANGFLRDSDAVMTGSSAVVTLTTGISGTNDHTFDIGFQPQRVDLSLTKTVTGPVFAAGRQITYTLRVTNATDCGAFGPCATATDVTVRDVLPNEVTFLSADPAAAFNTTTGLWTVGTLAPGATATLTITARIKDTVSGTVRNYAQVQTQTGPPDVDSTPGNGNPLLPPAEDDEAEVPFFVATARLGDFVWIDKNGNGCQDTGEVGLPGVTVALLDGAGNVLNTTTTDANGSYLFSNLAAGSYSVRFTAPAGYGFTTRAVGACGGEKDSDADPATGRTQTVTLTSTGADLTLDAGFYQLASLGDMVWVDNNRNGLMDAGEPGLAGVTVTLNNANGGNVATATTDANGKYSFTGLAPGVYGVTFSGLPQGYVFSPRDQGTDETRDSDADPANGRTATVMLMSGQAYLDLDAGVYPRIDLSLTKVVSPATGPYTTGDSITYTITVTNAVGYAPATNVTVRDVIPNGLGAVTATPSVGTFDSATGTWNIGTLAAGASATLQLATTLAATTGGVTNCAQVQTAGQLDIDSTPGNANFANGALEDDEACVSVNVVTASLGDFVWLDVNGNGCQDAGEPGVAGVLVTLFKSDGTQVGTRTTNANGQYLFESLDPGSYYVTFGKPAGYDFTSQKKCGNDATDSDPDPASGRTGVFTLGDNQGRRDIDAGLVQSACISGFVYVDANDNGIKEATEAGIPGATITLTGTDNQGNSITRSTSTGTDGSYQFCNLAPGTYKLSETQPATYLDGKDTAGSLGGTVTNDMIASIVLVSGANGTNYNFGELSTFDLALTKQHVGEMQAGEVETYTLTVRNLGPGTTSGPITVTDNLPGGMTYVSASGTGWTCAAGAGNSSVSCTFSGTVAPNSSTSFALRVRLALNINCAFVNVATVAATGDNNAANNTARDTTTIANCTTSSTPDPGTPGAQPGSLLIFPVYTSDASNPGRENTKICVTNTDPVKPVNVHLFFVDGNTCSVADSFICLTQNQTACFLASDVDPGTMGYVVAVATDDNGCPIRFNRLIGDEYAKFSSGHSGALTAESYQQVQTTPITCAATDGLVELKLDGNMYQATGRTLASSSILSRADGNSTLLTLVRTGGNLATGAGSLGSVFGLLYDESENPFSFSFSSSSCQVKQELSDNFPRTSPRFSALIPAGRSGWMKFYSAQGFGLAGAVFNYNPNSISNNGAINGGRSLHKLTLGSDSYLIPIFPPSC